MNSTFPIKLVKLSKIIADSGTQARESMNPDAVQDYSDAMEGGATFPPIVVFQDGASYHLGDGFHRVAAARKIGMLALEAELRPGGIRGAVLFSAGANGDHGLRRTNADKRRAVSRLLDDPEWAQWSDRQLADHCKVTHPFVAKIRRDRVVIVTGVTPTPEPQEAPRDIAPEPLNPAPESILDDSDIDYLEVAPEPAEAPTLELTPTPKSKPADVATLEARVRELEAQLGECSQLLKDTQEEVDSLRRIVDAEDLLEQFNKEVKRYQAQASVTQSRNNGLMNENSDLKGRLKSALSKIERLEKAAKEVAE